MLPVHGTRAKVTIILGLGSASNSSNSLKSLNTGEQPKSLNIFHRQSGLKFVEMNKKIFAFDGQKMKKNLSVRSLSKSGGLKTTQQQNLFMILRSPLYFILMLFAYLRVRFNMFYALFCLTFCFGNALFKDRFAVKQTIKTILYNGCFPG